MNAPARQAPFLPLFLRLKWRIIDNQLNHLRRHMWINVAVGFIVLSMIVGGGTLLFDIVFGYLSRLEVIGPLMVDQLVKMVLLAFFSMLTFSNLIIMLTTTYFSREVDYLMSQPIDHRQLFFAKLSESIIYSTWAFIVLAIPLFVALGRTYDLGPTYYAGAVILIIPFLILPAALGSAIALLVTVYLSPRKAIRYALAMIAIGLVVGALLANRSGGLHMLPGAGGTGGAGELERIVRFMAVGDVLLMPSGWVGRGLTALQYGDVREALFWAGALWTSAAMGLVVLDWMAGPFYYRGWVNVRGAGAARRRRREGLYGAFESLLFFLPRGSRALVAKDLAVFWRDPAQWSQLLILLGLLFLYVSNLRSAGGASRFETVFPAWRLMLSLFNIGATTFVLSIMTTRFVYPMLSLEGKQQWVIGLAPLGRTHLVWEKFIVSWIGATAITLPLAVLSSVMLETDPFITAMTVAMVVCMAVGLSALAVGLGAMMPNFNDDNPARIASGLGGTINAVVSILYIILSLLLVTPWVYVQLEHRMPTGGFMLWICWTSVPLWCLLQLAVIVVPLRLGLSRWRRMEF